MTMNESSNHDFDAIVVGSGISGGWAAKELAEKGLRVLVLERGKPLQAGSGYLGDTPGFSEVGLWGLAPRDLAHCFPEFRPLVEQCRFPDCSHTHEPGCAELPGSPETIRQTMRSSRPRRLNVRISSLTQRERAAAGEQMTI